MQPASSRSGRQSPLEYDFNGVVLLSSERAGWNGLAMRYYRTSANYQASVPAFSLDALALQVQGATPLTSTVAGAVQRVHSVPGDIYLIPRGEASMWQAREACELLHIYAAPALLGSVALESADIDPQRVELAPRVQARDPLIQQIGLALLDELRAGGPLGRIYVESLAQLLVIHLLRKHATVSTPVAEPAGGLPAATLRRVYDFIGENLAYDLSLDVIAGVAGISAFHFTRLFKQSAGLPLHRYIIQRRLSEAKRLLLTGRLTIAEVAALTGFADQSHLHRHFKAAYCVTPGALLRRPENRQEASHD
jgi:AraC family transcriptional regulator